MFLEEDVLGEAECAFRDGSVRGTADGVGPASETISESIATSSAQ